METAEQAPRYSTRGIVRPLIFLRDVFAQIIPFLLALYTISLMTSMSGMEIFGWATCTFTLLYLGVQNILGGRRRPIFFLGAELPLLGLILVALIGLWINVPEGDYIAPMGKLRWIIMLYLLAYTLAAFPSLNRILNIMMIVGTLVGAYAIFQHYTGIDLIRGDNRSVTPAPFEGADVFQSVGFLSHHLTYGYSFGMLVCFPFAALLLSRRKSFKTKLGLFLSVIIIGLSLYWTYGRGVWLSTALAFSIIAAYVSKKHFVAILLILGVIGGVLYTSSPGFQERFESIFASNYFSNNDRQDIWRANLAMFNDHPWFGVGFGRNEELLGDYFKSLNINNEFGGHAHNNYLQMLSTTGITGFFCYMIFILTFLLMTHRLWNDIPRTHYWHRVIALGALGAQVCMHAGGLTQWNFGDAEVNHLFIFVLAMVAYLSEKYSRGIVPDDYSL